VRIKGGFLESRNFDNYALDAAEKFTPGCVAVLSRNQVKVWGKMLKPLLSTIENARTILDFGCGAGEFLLFLSNLTNAKLHGFEVSNSQLELARKRIAGKPQVFCTDKLTELNNEYDLVFCFHVIEHIADNELEKFMTTLTNLVDPSGKLVISTPNGLNPFSHAFFMSFDHTHVRMHSPFTLAEILRPHGFRIEGVYRELPQAYDISSYAKTIVWWLASQVVKLGVISCAGGVRGLRFPLIMASTIFILASKVDESSVPLKS